MTDRLYKRIFKIDIKNYTRNQLDDIGIFIHFDETDLTNASILIVGPEDTPFEGGYYIFKVKFPENYPFKAPAVHFCSIGGTRIHPNLYVGGKVCLSILGTWAGPSWTSAMDISIIAKTIQSLMSKHAIQNEPGYQFETGVKSKNYDSVITYTNVKDYIITQVIYAKKKRSYGFEQCILEHFNKKKLLERIDKLKKICPEEDEIFIDLYSIKSTINYNYLEKMACDI